MTERTCQNCGVVNTGIASFCKSCGKFLPKKQDVVLSELSLIVNGQETTKFETEQRQAEGQIPQIEQKGTNSFAQKILAFFMAIPLFLIDFKERNAAFYRIIPIFISIIITIVFQKTVFVSFAYGSFIHRVFLPGGEWYLRVIPASIFFLTVWVIIDVVLKNLMLFAEIRNLNHGYILRIPDVIQSESIQNILNQLKGLQKRMKKGRSYKRIYSLLEKLNLAGGMQSNDELFSDQSNIEADNAASEYTVSRMLTWSMPIMGFMGTAIGISLAVGNFAGFLSGNIDDIVLVKRELSKITSGLSFAFDNTILGLATSLIAMLCISFTQKSEEGFLTKIEELGLNIISNCKRKTSHSFTNTNTAHDSLSVSLEEFKRTMDTQTVKLSDGIKNFTENFQKASNTMSDIFSGLPQKLDESSNLIKNKVKELEEFDYQIKTTFHDGMNQFKNSFDLLAAKIGSLAVSQEITKSVTKELVAFNQLVKGMQETHGKTIALLNNLSRPLEFRLVPAQNNS